MKHIRQDIGNALIAGHFRRTSKPSSFEPRMASASFSMHVDPKNIQTHFLRARGDMVDVRMTMWRAPACLEMGKAMQPIGPAPVISTSSPTRSNESAVWTAFPKGSKQERTSSGIDGSACQQFDCGMATNSAHAPGRFTPTPCVFGQR